MLPPVQCEVSRMESEVDNAEPLFINQKPFNYNETSIT